MASHVDETNARNAANDARAALLNGGRIDFTTAADAVLISFDPLPNPAFGASSVGVATLDNSPVLEETATATGTVAKAKGYTSGGALVWTEDVSTVAAGTGTWQIISTSIVSGQVYQIDTAGYTLTQPAGT
jgi:hypothetical protein